MTFVGGGLDRKTSSGERRYIIVPELSEGATLSMWVLARGQPDDEGGEVEKSTSRRRTNRPTPRRASPGADPCLRQKN